MSTTIPEDLTLYHLTARGCSGKAVRCRILSATQIDAVVTAAAKRITPDSTTIELARIEQRLGVETMVVDVSTAKIPPLEVKKRADAEGKFTVDEIVDHTLDPEIRWEAFDPEKRQLTAKDWSALMSIYAREYNVSQADVDAIMGKARTVSTG